MRRLLLLLLLPAALLVVADRIAAGYAAGRVADRLLAQRAFQSRPDVRVRGVPFLTQALAGRYDGADIRGSTAASPHATVDAHVQGIRLPLRRLASGRLDGAVADRVTAQVTASYAELAATLGGGVRLRGGGGQVQVSGVVPGVTASARPVLQGNRVRLELAQARAGALGVDLPAASVRLPSLPLGLRYTGLRVGSDGVVLTAAGRDVRLRE